MLFALLLISQTQAFLGSAASLSQHTALRCSDHFLLDPQINRSTTENLPLNTPESRFSFLFPFPHLSLESTFS